MSISVSEVLGGKLVEIGVSGKLTKDDYTNFVPRIEALIQRHGKIDVILNMHDFHGWNPSALWEDLKFDARHFAHIGRLAIIGEKKWQEWMATICKPFTTADVKFFNQSETTEAHRWIHMATV